MTTWGIWDEGAGGIVYAPCYTADEAAAELERLAAEAAAGGDEADLSVVELCGDHEEQPKDGCEECPEDDDDNPDDDEDDDQ